MSAPSGVETAEPTIGSAAWELPPGKIEDVRTRGDRASYHVSGTARRREWRGFVPSYLKEKDE